MRGSPDAGAPASSSSGTWCARAIGSRSSSVGRRCPDSSRDRVLTEILVLSAICSRVPPRCLRRARSRGPTAARTVRRSSVMLPVCHSGNFRCQKLASGGILGAMADKNGRDSEQAAPGIGRTADVIVVGGGLAGLAGALTLVRARRSVLVVDADHPRNAPAAHAHGYLTRDGASPLELLAAGRAEVAGYGGQLMTGTVTSLARLPAAASRLRWPTAPAARHAGCWWPPAWSTNTPAFPACAAAGAATSCTARSASAGNCATSRSQSWPPARRPPRKR